MATEVIMRAVMAVGFVIAVLSLGCDQMSGDNVVSETTCNGIKVQLHASAAKYVDLDSVRVNGTALAGVFQVKERAPNNSLFALAYDKEGLQVGLMQLGTFPGVGEKTDRMLCRLSQNSPTTIAIKVINNQ
jgi:hypothetical protein